MPLSGAGLLLAAIVAPIMFVMVRAGGRCLRKFTGAPLMVAESVFIIAGVVAVTVGIRLMWW